MNRLRPSVLFPLLVASVLAGCGGEFARIDGLPETRDVSAVPWPRLVDTPAIPTDSLLPARGAQTFVRLDGTRQTVLNRAALPGPQRVAVAELDGRVARIRQQSAIEMPGVDQADMAARAARLSDVRAIPVSALPAAELQARAQRVAVARNQTRSAIDATDLQARAQRIQNASSLAQNAIDATDLQARAQRIQNASSLAPSGVDAYALQERAQRVAAARSQGGSMADPVALGARADRARAQAQSYGGYVDRNDLTLRSQRIGAVTTSASSTVPVDLLARRERVVTPFAELPDLASRGRGMTEQGDSAPVPVRKPVRASRQPDRDKPVLSNDFLERAAAARKRALERATAAE